MSRPRMALLTLALTAALAGCASASAEPAPTEPATSVQESAPEPACAPAGVASDTPPEPIEDGSYRDGASYEC